MVKLKVSYERPEELKTVIRLLSPVIQSWRKSGNNKGRFKKAYIDLNHGGTTGKQRKIVEKGGIEIIGKV